MMKKKQRSKIVLVAGLSALTIIESVALLNGINGTLLMVVVAVIAGVVGVSIPTPKGWL